MKISISQQLDLFSTRILMLACVFQPVLAVHYHQLISKKAIKH